MWTQRIAMALRTSCLGLIGLVCAAGTSAAENRTISFYNMHTKETLTVTYKRNGSYDQDALTKINHILRDWRRNETIRMEPKLIDLAYDVHEALGSHEPIHIVSGYRSPVTNAALRRRSSGVAKQSRHMLGHAMDMYFPDVALSKIRETALKFQRGGVGYYPTSGRPFVHIDVGNVRHWPRMTRDQLARIFPDGNTLHIPADGKPLPRKVRTDAILVATNRTDDAATPVARRGRDDQPIVTARASDPVLPQPRNVILNKPTPTLVSLFTGNDEDDEGGGAAANQSQTQSSPALMANAAPPPLPPSRPVLLAALPPSRVPAPAKPSPMVLASAPMPDLRSNESATLAGLIASLPRTETTASLPQPQAGTAANTPALLTTVSNTRRKGDKQTGPALASRGGPLPASMASLVVASLGPSLGSPAATPAATQPAPALQAAADGIWASELTYQAPRVRSLVSSRRILGSSFAMLSAPDQLNLDGLIQSPGVSIAISFSHSIDPAPSIEGFSGRAIAPLRITNHLVSPLLAMAAR